MILHPFVSHGTFNAFMKCVNWTCPVLTGMLLIHWGWAAQAELGKQKHIKEGQHKPFGANANVIRCLL